MVGIECFGALELRAELLRAARARCVSSLDVPRLCEV